MSLGLNFSTMSEAFGMSEEKLRRMDDEGVKCPECGKFLENLGYVIDHEH